MMDEWTTKHFENWLQREHGNRWGDIAASRIRVKMLAVWNDDPEFWGNHTWTELFDRSVTQNEYNQICADAVIQADVDAMAARTLRHC